MSFENGANDFDLLQAAGIGVAVGGGDPRLLRLADSVCEPSARDGEAAKGQAKIAAAPYSLWWIIEGESGIIKI